MSIEHDCEQYSDEWHRLRLGIPTTSEFHNIFTPGGIPTRGDKRKRYMFKKIAERLIQQSMDDTFKGYWTKRGKEIEGDASIAFAGHEDIAKLIVGGWHMRKSGFWTTNDGKVGASPDRVLQRKMGLPPTEGVEIKCPSPWVQVEYLLEGPEDNYKPQVQGHMLVCGFRRVHLFSYHPLMPSVHKTFEREDDYCDKLARELFAFCNELDVETDRARRIGPFKLAELLRLSAEMADDSSIFAGLQ